MVEQSAITEAIRKAIGREMGPYVYEVEKGAIRKFAEAIDDPNPLWQEEDYAKESRYGGIIASPSFVTSLKVPGLTEWVLGLDCPLKRLLNGGNELEFFQPLRPGDVISVTARLSQAYEREGKAGKMVFLIIETDYTNQRGELAVRGRQTLIKY